MSEFSAVSRGGCMRRANSHDRGCDPFSCNTGTAARVVLSLALVCAGGVCERCSAEDWPRWRGPAGNAVSSDAPLPRTWSAERNVRWKVEVPGEGFSSPIVCGGRVFVTESFEGGLQRQLRCLDRDTGRSIWTRAIDDDNPEPASSMTGHAASTPVTDGQRVVAWFGNAGVVCCNVNGEQLWHHDFGEFESELGLASSPVICGETVILVCDHDGDRFRSFDSFLVALDLKTGDVRWKTERKGLFRSWSTPILVPAGADRRELIVNAQDQLRGYDPEGGGLLWSVDGMTGWVTPSPVFGHGLIFATSGRDGPTMAVRPGGRGDATNTHVEWLERRGAPYVCSPVLYGRELYVHNENGILTCYNALTGKVHYRERLPGKFVASSIAGDGKAYFTNDAGTTYVVEAGPRFKLLASNPLDEYTLASPAAASGALFLRTERHLYCIAEPDGEEEKLQSSHADRTSE